MYLLDADECLYARADCVKQPFFNVSGSAVLLRRCVWELIFGDVVADVLCGRSVSIISFLNFVRDELR